MKVAEDMKTRQETQQRRLDAWRAPQRIFQSLLEFMSPESVTFLLVLDYLLKDCLSLTDVTALLFADDAVLISSNPQALQEALNEWNRALSGGGLRIHELKTDHLHCAFRDPFEPTPDFVLNGIGKCNKFKYLGSWVNQEATCDVDVNHRVSVGCSKWKKNYGLICGQKCRPHLKESSTQLSCVRRSHMVHPRGLCTKRMRIS